MQKIRVLHIIKSLGRGGAEMLLPQTLKIHNQERFEFHYLYFLPWKDQMVGEIRSFGGKVTCFSASNNIQLLQQSKNVIHYCRDNKIDVIHCHLPWSGFLGRLIHKKSGIPLLYTEHNIQERYHVATKVLNKLSFNFQNIAIGVSKDVTRSIRENINPKIPVKTILNGVNTEFFRRDLNKGKFIREKFNIPHDAIVIGNIAVFREQKALPVWLKAFKKVISEFPNVYGILVGAGPLEGEIKSLISELEISSNLILPGLQTDTVSYFSAMDIFMMSSDFEGLPIALLEAMSMECAVVSTKAGGVTEVIREEKDGLLCETGESNCLAKQVSYLTENDEIRREFQKSARERVQSAFSLKTMVNELEECYLELSGGVKSERVKSKE